MKKLLLLFINLNLLVWIPVQPQEAQIQESFQVRSSGAINFPQKTQIKIAGEKSVTKVDELVKNVFLGQVYSSGNVYLKAFETSSEAKWSKVISFTSLRKQQNKTKPKNYQAEFKKILNVEGDGASFVNFPKEEKQRAMVEYFKEDFFETILDEMPEDEKIGLYKANEKISSAFAVFAFSKEIEINEIIYPPKSLVRFLTKKEKREVMRLKRESKNETKGWECTTIPAFLDSAKQLLTFKVKGTDYAGRVSGYSNPGCLGHLGHIYILDIFQNGGLKQTFELTHYEGAI